MNHTIVYVADKAEISINIDIIKLQLFINLEINNISNKDIIIHDAFFKRDQSIYFVNSNGKKGRFFPKIQSTYDYTIYDKSLYILKPNEKIGYNRTYDFILNKLETVISNKEFEILFDKDEKISVVIIYLISDDDLIQIRKATGTQDYILESFKYTLPISELTK